MYTRDYLYTGEVLKNVPHGKGRLVGKSGGYVEGKVSDGIFYKSDDGVICKLSKILKFCFVVKIQLKNGTYSCGHHKNGMCFGKSTKYTP